MIRGRIDEGLRFLFYSAEGVGKSTLAAHAPEPLFIDVEDGTGRLEVTRYAFHDGPGGHVPRSYSEVLGAVDDLRRNETPFRTLVIDTVDRLEALIHAHVLAQYSNKRDDTFNRSGREMKSIESFGYGKGFSIALDEFRALCSTLDSLRRERGMHVILLGHAQVKLYKNPRGEDFDRYQLRINDKAGGFLKEWCDLVGFCAFEEHSAKLDPDAAKAKGFETGRRMMYLDRKATYDAKTRLPLPAEIELELADPWGPLGKALAECKDDGPDVITKRIEAELTRIGDDELARKVHGAVQKAGDHASELVRILNKLKGMAPAEVAA